MNWHVKRGDKIKVADLEKLGPSFAFDVVKNYKVGNPVTDRADFVTLADGVLTPKVYETEGRAAISVLLSYVFV